MQFCCIEDSFDYPLADVVGRQGMPCVVNAPKFFYRNIASAVKIAVDAYIGVERLRFDRFSTSRTP